jgi:hypothetical protein
MHDVEHSVGLGSCRIMLKAYDGNNSSTLLGSVLRRSGKSKPISDSKRNNLLIEVSTGCFAIFQEKYWGKAKRRYPQLLCSLRKLLIPERPGSAKAEISVFSPIFGLEYHHLSIPWHNHIGWHRKAQIKRFHPIYQVL